MEGNKQKIIKSLKDIIVPEIKNLSFSGTFPDFRRKNHDRYEFLSFQFNRNDGSFIIETGFVYPDKLRDFEKALPFEELNYGNAHIENRLRIKPENSSEDFWYEYSDFSEESQFKKLAQTIKDLLPKVETFLQK